MSAHPVECEVVQMLRALYRSLNPSQKWNFELFVIKFVSDLDPTQQGIAMKLIDELRLTNVDEDSTKPKALC